MGNECSKQNADILPYSSQFMPKVQTIQNVATVDGSSDSIDGIIVVPFSEDLEEYLRGPATDQIAKQFLERAAGKKLTEIYMGAWFGLPYAMRDYLKFVMNNEIDTRVQTTGISQSEDAKTAEKLMHGINDHNLQVWTLHVSPDIENGIEIKLLSDYPCIEFNFKNREINKWQKEIKKKMAAIEKNEQVSDEIKPVVLKEYVASIKADVNYYSLTTIDENRETKLVIQNQDEIKNGRKRPDDHAKADG